MIEVVVVVHDITAVPPTAIEIFVAAVPKIPVFALFVGRTAQVVTVDAPEQANGPDEVNPPEPDVIVPVPEVLIAELADKTNPDAFIVVLNTPAVVMLIVPAADEKIPSVKRVPIAKLGNAAVPKDDESNRPLAILTFEFSTRIASEFVIVTFVPANGAF